MGTRSSITVHNPETGYHTSVYCHWDGYLSHNGAKLHKHYNSYEKAMALVSLGFISSLGESIECPEGHSFDNRVAGYTAFYHRDRGEELEKYTFKSIKSCLRRTEDNICYLYRDGQWWVSMRNREYTFKGMRWLPLERALFLYNLHGDDDLLYDADKGDSIYQGNKIYR